MAVSVPVVAVDVRVVFHWLADVSHLINIMIYDRTTGGFYGQIVLQLNLGFTIFCPRFFKKIDKI